MKSPITPSPVRKAVNIFFTGAIRTTAGVGPGAHVAAEVGDKRLATSTHRLRALREAVIKGENSFTDFTPVSDDDAAREHLLMHLRLSEASILRPHQARWGARPSSAKLAPLLETKAASPGRRDDPRTPQGPGAECSYFSFAELSPLRRPPHRKRCYVRTLPLLTTPPTSMLRMRGGDGPDASFKSFS